LKQKDRSETVCSRSIKSTALQHLFALGMPPFQAFSQGVQMGLILTAELVEKIGQFLVAKKQGIMYMDSYEVLFHIHG
jgi:hypothetical protein